MLIDRQSWKSARNVEQRVSLFPLGLYATLKSRTRVTSLEMLPIGFDRPIYREILLNFSSNRFFTYACDCWVKELSFCDDVCIDFIGTGIFVWFSRENFEFHSNYGALFELCISMFGIVLFTSWFMLFRFINYTYTECDHWARFEYLFISRNISNQIQILFVLWGEMLNLFVISKFA